MADIHVFDPAPEGTPVSNFVHLHVHSDYSLLDSCAKIDELVAKAKRLNMRALALTDHGNMFGVLNFEHLCHANGINPIVGEEFYVAYGSHAEQRDAPFGKNGKGAHYFHLILLCENEIGYKNMCQLSSIAYIEGIYYGKPRIDFELLKKYHEGLICLSACIQGELPQLLLAGKDEDARRLAIEYKKLFGRDRYYIELQDHGLEDQAKVAPKLIQLADELDIPLVVTNDIHYIEKEDAEAQDALRCIGFKKLLNEPHQTMGEGKSEWYFKTEEEMRRLFPERPDAIENTVKIARMCDLTIHQYTTRELKNCLPRFELPAEFRRHEDYTKNQDDYVRFLVEEGLKKRYAEITEEIRDRAEYELSTIFKMGFSGYFLIVWEFIHWAKEHEIPIGPGRGSGAGSLVAYCLEITDIDPFRYGLIFERFLNPERVSMPDFDVDMDFDFRQDIIRHTRELYGESQVGHIVTFGTLKAKQVIADVGRVLGIPLSEVNMLKKCVPDNPKATLKSAFEKPNAKFPDGGKLLPYKDDPRYKKLFELASKLENVNRNTGLHASGMVIGLTALPNWAPVFKDPKTHEVAVQYTMDIIEPCGLVKFDYLGLKTLSLIRYTEEIINKHKKSGEPAFKTENASETDSATFDMFCRGDSVAIFQFESPGMQKILKQAKPRKIEELVALNALYRPGPMDFIPNYIAGKWKPETIHYPDPCLEDILKETYGVMVYQEQVMQVSRRIAGFSLGEADMLRRAMGKKKADILMGKQKEFEEGAVKQGFTKEHAAEIFNIMVPFAGYGFNKSHAAAYSVLAYRTGYLKCHYPAEFMAANLTNEINSTDGLPAYIAEAKKMGIEVDPPDINRSDCNFDVVNGHIVFGFRGIKGMGSGAANAIVKEREKNGSYKDFLDFLHRVLFLKDELPPSADEESENEESAEKTDKPKEAKLAVNKKAIEVLIKTGAFDKLDKNRATLIQNYERAIEWEEDKSRGLEAGQVSLFEDTDEKVFSDFKWEESEELPKTEKLNMEKELIGCYVSGHPLDDYKAAFEKATLNSRNIEREAKIAEAEKQNQPSSANSRYRFAKSSFGKEYTVIGMISDLRPMTTKNGSQMAFAKLQDYTGAISLTFFPKIWEEAKNRLREEEVFAFKGKLDASRGEPVFFVNSFEDPKALASRAFKEVHIKLEDGFREKQQIADLQKFLSGKTGNCSVYFHLDVAEGSYALKAGSEFSVPSTKAFLDGLRAQPFVKEVWSA